MEIEIEYDGAYPNLCSGELVVVIDGKRWVFPCRSLDSGGSVWFDEDWGEHVEDGPWSVVRWPDNFPEEQKGLVEDAVNKSIPRGCCGGCV